jgi:hypothetical protein
MAGEKQDHMKIPKLQKFIYVNRCKSEGSAITFYLNTEARSKQDKSSACFFLHFKNIFKNFEFFFFKLIFFNI